MAYLFIFRMILVIIIFIVSLIPYLYLNFNSWWIKVMSKLLLKIPNFKNIKVNNSKLFKHYINTDNKIINSCKS